MENRNAVLSVVLGCFLLSSSASANQQEIDPTWYDPWAPSQATTSVSHHSETTAKSHRKTGSTSPIAQSNAVWHSVKEAQVKKASIPAERSHIKQGSQRK